MAAKRGLPLNRARALRGRVDFAGRPRHASPGSRLPPLPVHQGKRLTATREKRGGLESRHARFHFHREAPGWGWAVREPLGAADAVCEPRDDLQGTWSVWAP